MASKEKETIWDHITLVALAAYIKAFKKITRIELAINLVTDTQLFLHLNFFMAKAAHPTMTKTKVKDLIWKQNQDTNILGNIIRNKQMPMCKLS